MEIPACQKNSKTRKIFQKPLDSLCLLYHTNHIEFIYAEGAFYGEELQI
jgi:hypothetical protein